MNSKRRLLIFPLLALWSWPGAVLVAEAEQLVAPRSIDPGNLSTPSGTVNPSAGVMLPLHRSQLEQELAVLGVNAVYFATVQTGNAELHLSGTIIELAENSFSYSADPTETMRLLFRNGMSLE